MRLSIFLIILVGVCVALICADKPVKAQEYPWCAYYNSFHGGATNCGFSTYQQCMATISGVGGSCGANPRYHGPPQGPGRPRRYPY